MIERAVYSWVFGLNFALDNIVITPCVPKEYANAEITTPFNGHNLTIKYVGYGAKIESAKIESAKIESAKIESAKIESATVNGKYLRVSAAGRSVGFDKSSIECDSTVTVVLKS